MREDPEDVHEIKLVFSARECVATLFAINSVLHGEPVPDGYGHLLLHIAEGLGMIVKDPHWHPAHYFDGAGGQTETPGNSS